MPYRNVPKDKWGSMDRCVEDVMAQGKPKERAIAICHASIVGDKKKADVTPTININFYGDYWQDVVKGEQMIDENDDLSITKQEEIDGKGVNQENMTQDLEKEMQGMSKEMKACMSDKMKGGMSVKEARTACEKTGNKEEKKADVVEETKVEEKTEETPAVTPEPEKTDGVEAPKEGEQEVAEEQKPADIEEAESVSSLLKQTIAKIDQLLTVKEVKKADEEPAAPADGTTSEEVAPEGGAGEAPKEDKGGGVSPGGAGGSEELSKVNDNLVKMVDRVEKLDSSIQNLATRLTKLEEQPVPSKVVSPAVISKSGVVSQDSAPVNERLAQIDKELEQLETLRRSNLTKYQMERGWEKAFPLIDERNMLKAQLG